MEMTTLTVQVDDALLSRARQLAAARGLSISEFLERLLRVAAQPPLPVADLPPLTRQASGLLPPMTDEQVKQTLEEERARTHGS
jgi:antitoxin component of RelBE/YafQ-DinJ toxin-antitoxin module